MPWGGGDLGGFAFGGVVEDKAALVFVFVPVDFHAHDEHAVFGVDDDGDALDVGEDVGGLGVVEAEEVADACAAHGGAFDSHSEGIGACECLLGDDFADLGGSRGGDLKDGWRSAHADGCSRRAGSDSVFLFGDLALISTKSKWKNCMADRLFEEFAPVSSEDWLKQIEKDLKGAPLSRLAWEHETGLGLGAVYGPEGVRAEVKGSFPGMGDLRRGARPLMYAKGGWEICQDIPVLGVENLKECLGAFSTFPDAVRLVLPRSLRGGFAGAGKGLNYLEDHGAEWQEGKVWGDALRPIVEAGAGLRFDGGQGFLAQYVLMVRGLDGVDMAGLKGDVGCGPLAAVGLAPVPAAALGRLMEDALAVYLDARVRLPEMRSVVVSLEGAALAGADLVQQVAFGLGMAVEYAEAFGQGGVGVGEVFGRLGFHFPVSTDFLGEIARFRAFRMLWVAVLRAYGLGERAGELTYLMASGSRRQVSVLDPQTNILRATTQAMSAILGGCDSISVPAFDELYGGNTALGLRLAGNVQRILRDECLLDKVIDPVGGAYFVEHMTDALAEKAWALFQDIESKGGYRAALQSGYLEGLVKASADKRTAAIQKGKVTVLGVNQYPLGGEKLDDRVVRAEGEKAAVALDAAVTGALGQVVEKRVEALIAVGEGLRFDEVLAGQRSLWGGEELPALVAGRDSEGFERLRARTAAHVRAGRAMPTALLLTYGEVAMRKARAGFCANLVGCAGLAVVENQFPDDLEAAVEAAKGFNPEVIFFCSTDEGYFERGPGLLEVFCKQLPFARLVLAGRPQGWESLKEYGLDGCVYAGMDRLVFLEELLDVIQVGKEVSHAS